MDLSINEGTLVVTGGTGRSPEAAIVIRKTPRGLSAAGAEHLLLTQRYGEKGADWTIERQELLTAGTRTYDVYRIALRGGGRRTIYFDVTEWLARLRAAGG